MNRDKNCLVIYNPISGRGISKDILLEYKRILTSRGYSVNFGATEYSNHAIEMVMNADYYDIVFSIGGDGTLNEVVKGNYLRDNRLIICPLPSGTCNDVATMLGYGSNLVDNLNMALDGEVHDIDIGTINDNPFSYVVGMGKFMNIAYETKSEDKRRSGYLAYIKEGFSEIFEKIKLYKAEVVVDGVSMDGGYSLIMISNANHIAGIDNFHKEVCLNDGQMEVLLCRADNKIEFVKNFLKYFVGIKSDEIVVLRTKEVTVKLLDQLDKNWCVDGERYDYDGMEYNIKVNDKMKFLTPRSKGKIKKLFRC